MPGWERRSELCSWHAEHASHDVHAGSPEAVEALLRAAGNATGEDLEKVLASGTNIDSQDQVCRLQVRRTGSFGSLSTTT